MEHHNMKVGKKVIVLGGGNTAMDAASESSRMGAEKVVLCYRRSKNEMRAYWFEYDLAKSVGTSGIFNVVPIEILGSKKVEGVKFARSETANGKIQIIQATIFLLESNRNLKNNIRGLENVFFILIN